MTTCPHCGRGNRSGAGFCAWCGASLAAGRPGASHQKPHAAAPPPQRNDAGEGASGRQAAPEAPAEERAGSDQAWEDEEGDIWRDVATGIAGAGDAPDEPSLEESNASPPGDNGLTGRPTVKLAEPEVPGEPVAQARDDTTPLAIGTVVAERYEIVELVESSPEYNRYRARDLVRCATCGYQGNALGDAYCAECGASLQTPAYADILEQLRVPPEAYDARFSEGRRDYYVSVEPAQLEAAPPIEGAAQALRLAWGRATDAGLKRDHNEDYVEGWLYARDSGGLVALFVVADGLGGQDSGEVASRLATELVWGSLRDSVWQPIIQGEELPPDALEERVASAVRSANRAVYEERIARGSEMSTTLTMALVVDTTAYIANVGDSRSYLWNADGLQRITRDHSLVQRLVDAGQIAPRDVYTHPQRNLIYQSIGDRPEVQVDTFRRSLAPDDRLVLCSDGLWEMVHDDGLEEVLLSEPDPQRACDRLVQNANLAGGEDNITVIIVQAQRA